MYLRANTVMYVYISTVYIYAYESMSMYSMYVDVCMYMYIYIYIYIILFYQELLKEKSNPQLKGNRKGIIVKDKEFYIPIFNTFPTR